MRIIKKRGNELGNRSGFYILASIALMCNSLYVKVRFFTEHAKTPLIFFLATVKNNLRFHIPVTKAVQSLYEK
mgnify:CR=1 FL=1